MVLISERLQNLGLASLPRKDAQPAVFWVTTLDRPYIFNYHWPKKVAEDIPRGPDLNLAATNNMAVLVALHKGCPQTAML